MVNYKEKVDFLSSFIVPKCIMAEIELESQAGGVMKFPQRVLAQSSAFRAL